MYFSAQKLFFYTYFSIKTFTVKDRLKAASAAQYSHPQLSPTRRKRSRSRASMFASSRFRRAEEFRGSECFLGREKSASSASFYSTAAAAWPPASPQKCQSPSHMMSCWKKPEGGDVQEQHDQEEEEEV